MSGVRTPGVYYLILHLREPARVRVGRLGRFAFPAGYYVYTGRAMGGLENRLARHRRRRKKLHWHIDYLRRRAEVVDSVARATRCDVECEWNRRVLSLPGASVVAPGFGASDCRCSTHLVWLPRRPVWQEQGEAGLSLGP